MLHTQLSDLTVMQAIMALLVYHGVAFTITLVFGLSLAAIKAMLD